MQPLGKKNPAEPLKKSHKLSGQISRNLFGQKVSEPLKTKKKLCNLLGQSKLCNLSRRPIRKSKKLEHVGNPINYKSRKIKIKMEKRIIKTDILNVQNFTQPEFGWKKFTPKRA